MTASGLRKLCPPKRRYEFTVGTPGPSAGEQTFVRDSMSPHLTLVGIHMICILKHSFNLKNAHL